MLALLLLAPAWADVVDPGAIPCDAAALCAPFPVVSCRTHTFQNPVPDCDAYADASKYVLACEHGGATVGSRDYCDASKAEPGTALPVMPPAARPDPADLWGEPNAADHGAAPVTPPPAPVEPASTASGGGWCGHTPVSTGLGAALLALAAAARRRRAFSTPTRSR